MQHSSASHLAGPPQTVADLQRQIDELTAELQAHTAERDQALAREAALGEILQVINSSRGELRPIFDAMLENAMVLCDAAFGGLWTFDQNRYVAVALHGVPKAYAEFLATATMSPGPGTAPYRLRYGERVVHNIDLAAEEAYRAGDPQRRALVDLGGARTALQVSLRKDDDALGVITIYRQEVRPFSDQQIALLQNFAAQAVIAMENARLLGETRQRTRDLEESLEYQTAMGDVLKVISRSVFDLDAVLQTVVTTAVQLCRADSATIYRNRDGVYVWAAGHMLNPEYERIERAVHDRPGPGTLVGRVAASGQTVEILDAWTDPLYEVKDEARVGGVRTMLGVPLTRDGVPVGVIGLARRTIRAFSEREIQLVTTFADQAGIAIENARLLNELQQRTRDLEEALETQTAIGEVTSAISRSVVDLDAVLKTVVVTAIRLCRADHAAIYRNIGGEFRWAVGHGLSPEYEEIERNVRITPAPGTCVGRAALDARWVQIDDAWNDPLYKVKDDARTGNVRTLLGVPLLRDDAVIGVIGLARGRVEPYSEREIQLVTTFADQAVIAIENARLFDQLRERTRDLQESLEYQTATSEVLQVISRSTFDLQPVLDKLLETAARLCSADMGLIAIRDGRVYPVASTFAFSPEWEAMVRKIRFAPGRGTVTGRAASERRTVHVTDVAADPEYTLPEVITVGNMRTALGVPLLREGEPLGVLYLARRRVEPFTERQIDLVRTFADQAVIAIENARLLSELRERTDELTRRAGELHASEERYSLAMRAINEGVYEWDIATGEMYYSPRVCELVGLPPTELRTMTDWTARIHPDDRERFRKAIIAHFRGETDWIEAEYRYRHADGSWHWASQHGIALKNEAGRAYRVVGSTGDITDRKVAEEALREALEQQTATAEVLQVINSSPGHLAPVFNAILDKALGLCGAAFGCLWTYDGERMRAAAVRGAPPDFAEFLTRAPHPVGPDNAHGRLLRGEPVVHITDVAGDAAYRTGDPVRRNLIELGGGRTLLAVPLRQDGKFLGDFVIYRQEVRPFTDKQIALLQNFAAQAVIAMDNARLITETREALEQQTATAEMLQVINSSPGDLAPVFDAILEKAHSLCDSGHGTLFLRDGDYFRPAAMRGVPEPIAKRLRGGVLGTEVPVSRPLLVGERFAHIEDTAHGDHPMIRLASENGVRTLLSVPLKKGDEVLGMIVAARFEAPPFSEKQIALLENFAAQAVIAMDNARLLNEIRQRQAELRVTFDHMGDGVAMFDSELRLAAWNTNFQKMLDLPEEFLAGRPDYESYVHYLAERGEFGGSDIEAELRRRLENTEQELRFERARPDGRVIEVRRNAVPGGGFVLMYSDVTERKRAEEEIRAARDAAERALTELKTAQASLIHAEKMASLGQLTAGIAHEIKNPLNFVNNFAGLSVELLDELKEMAEPGIATLDIETRAEIDETIDMLTGNLDRIAEHGRRADGIVQSMLAHSRGTSGERQKVDLNEIVDEALNLAYHGARAQDQSFNITLERDFAPSMPPVELVPQDMTRVFINLISNGFHAAQQRRKDTADQSFTPVLKMATRDLGDAVEVRVRDNGTGIPPEHRDKLFQPFFTTKPTGEGTGLGLSISYDIVTQQHGGMIEVDSEPGVFTEFTVRLPRSLSERSE